MFMKKSYRSVPIWPQQQVPNVPGCLLSTLKGVYTTNHRATSKFIVFKQKVRPLPPSFINIMYLSLSVNFSGKLNLGSPVTSAHPKPSSHRGTSSISVTPPRENEHPRPCFYFVGINCPSSPKRPQMGDGIARLIIIGLRPIIL